MKKILIAFGFAILVVAILCAIVTTFGWMTTGFSVPFTQILRNPCIRIVNFLCTFYGGIIAFETALDEQN
jgi:hypothetical protein